MCRAPLSFFASRQNSHLQQGVNANRCLGFDSMAFSVRHFANAFSSLVKILIILFETAASRLDEIPDQDN